MLKSDYMSADDQYDFAEEPVYEDPSGSVWVIGVDYSGILSLMKPPNVDPIFYEDWYAHTTGMPEYTDDVGPGVYRVTFNFCFADYPNGEIDFEFTPVKWEPLWQLEGES